ncbi:MAG: RNA polymerase sigma factor [Anaerolineales bacterium]|jgi:RNA polymerase sigma-70 factor (ECF subfamily)
MIKDQDQKIVSLDALREGDRPEFAKLVEEYSPMIYRLGLKMLNNPQDAEDILQETFIKAYKHIGKFDGRSSISTWLYRIATNEALMSLRKKRPDMISFDVPSINESEPQEPMQIVDWCCLPEEEFLSSEGRLRLDEAAERLPESLRIVFVLRDIEGLSTRETADVLDISEMAVKTRLSRARLRLREDLSTYFGKLVEKG